MESVQNVLFRIVQNAIAQHLQHAIDVMHLLKSPMMLLDVNVLMVNQSFQKVDVLHVLLIIARGVKMQF